MSALSETLGNAKGVPPHQIEVNGKTYTARLWDDGLKVGYERRVYEKHVQAEKILYDRGLHDRTTFDRRLDRLTDAYTQGMYSFEGEIGEGVLKTRAGLLIIISLMFGVPEMEAVSLLTSKPAEAAALVKLVLKESIPGVRFGAAEEGQGEAREVAEAVEGDHPN